MVRSFYQPKAKPVVSIAFLNTPAQILYIWQGSCATAVEIGALNKK
jgi:hypothetical protein